MSYFKPEEFACQCGCGKQGLAKSTRLRLETAREMAGVPFIITSGLRCEAHNKEEGGKDTSAHLNGYAVDIKATDSRTRFKILKALIAAGFTRIGIAKTFIHADDDPNKSPEVTWLY